MFLQLPVSSLFVSLNICLAGTFSNPLIYILPSQSAQSSYIVIIQLDISAYAYISISRATQVVAYSQKGYYIPLCGVTLMNESTC
jgi:hypothetical protein